jgi:hypothetical protein
MFDGIPKELRFFKNKEPIFQACFVPALQPLKIGPGEIIY